MKRYTVNINNFKLGEKPSLSVANTFVPSMAKKLINFIPGSNNVLMRRPGSKYVKTLSGQEIDNIKLFTLEINDFIYLLEFIPGKLRIYKNNVLLYNGESYEIPTPYTHAIHLKNLNITQGYKSNEVIFFCKYEAPLILTKDIKDDIFKFKPMNFIDGPYNNINTTEINLTPLKLSGENVNIKASAPVFSISDIGLSIRLFDEKSKIWGWGVINKFISDIQVQVDVKSNFGGYLPTGIWCKGIFNKSKGYPSMGIVFNSRLYVAHTLCNTTTIWTSCYNDYLNFAPTDLQSETIFIPKSESTSIYKHSITFGCNEIKEILWLKSTPYYVIAGSKEGIYAFMPLDFNKALSCYNYTIQKISELGSKDKVVGNNQFIFYENLKTNINALEYYTNLSSPNIVENILQLPNQLKQKISINNIVFSKSYESIITVVLSNGKLIFLNIHKNNQEIFYAFSHGILGGSVVKIKEATGTSNYLYLVVERVINQKCCTTLEYINWLDLNYALEDNFIIEDSYYLDCLYIRKSYIPLTYISINENIPTAIIADGCYLGEFCNENGIVALKIPAKTIIQGYNYLSIYQSECLNNLSLDYNLSGYKKLSNVTIGFINSLDGELESNHYTNKNLAIPYLQDIGKNFCTGYRCFHTNSSYFNEINFKIVQKKPFPFNINLIKAEILVN